MWINLRKSSSASSSFRKACKVVAKLSAAVIVLRLSGPCYNKTSISPICKVEMRMLMAHLQGLKSLSAIHMKQRTKYGGQTEEQERSLTETTWRQTIYHNNGFRKTLLTSTHLVSELNIWSLWVLELNTYTPIRTFLKIPKMCFEWQTKFEIPQKTSKSWSSNKPHTKIARQLVLIKQIPVTFLGCAESSAGCFLPLVICQCEPRSAYANRSAFANQTAL